MKLRSANVLRTFLYYTRQECANHFDCKGCAFYDEHCILGEKPRHWRGEKVLERYEKIEKGDEKCR